MGPALPIPFIIVLYTIYYNALSSVHILIEKYSSFVYRKWGEGLVVLASEIFEITLLVFRHHFVSSELIIQKQLSTTPFCHHGNLTWQPDRVYIPMCLSHKHMFTGNMQRY